MTPLGREFMTPLDEGMVMDMPITVPRASVTESVDDLKARDMVLCRFPEVDMVVGKAGRAETPTDPAPMDMIETMVNFRPRELWPGRSWPIETPLARPVGCSTPSSGPAWSSRLRTVGPRSRAAWPDHAHVRFPVREYAYHRNPEFLCERGPGAVTGLSRRVDEAQFARRRDHVSTQR